MENTLMYEPQREGTAKRKEMLIWGSMLVLMIIGMVCFYKALMSGNKQRILKVMIPFIILEVLNICLIVYKIRKREKDQQNNTDIWY